MESESKEPPDDVVVTDMHESLKNIIGEAGTVEIAYGGYGITILDQDNFPWDEVFDILVGEAFEVWLARKNSHLVIMAKNKID